jgi:DNA-binding XRE family transcriptional regulator
MPTLHEKIRAVRHMCGFSQSKVAELAHLNLKTYQRIEWGASALTENILEALAAAFNCTTDDIRNFDLEANQFGSDPRRLPEAERFEQENAALKSENDYLKHLLKTTLGDAPDLSGMLGGGGAEILET